MAFYMLDVMSCYMLCHVMLYVMSCYVVCYVMLCHVMLYVMPCYVLYYVKNDYLNTSLKCLLYVCINVLKILFEVFAKLKFYKTPKTWNEFTREYIFNNFFANLINQQDAAASWDVNDNDPDPMPRYDPTNENK